MAGRPGRKPKKSLEEQINEIISDIEMYKQSIHTLEEKKEELLKKKREQDLAELYDMITDMNLSISDVQSIIENCQSHDRNDNKPLEVIV